MREIDLHLHTTASDGTFSPTELVHHAKELGLRAIAITDHDTTAGYVEAAMAGEKLGIEVVPGIEVSTQFAGSVHILGYGIDPQCPQLNSALRCVVEERDIRNRKIAELMAADGLPVSYEDMQSRFGKVIGRPHFGRILTELGITDSINDAFDRYVGKGQRYYLPRTFISIEQTIELIVNAGGVAVLAHPLQYKRDDEQLRKLIEHCMESGLKGMECLYSGYTEEQKAYLISLAEEYNLLVTGGSDFHGANKPHIKLGSGIDNELNILYELLEKLKD